MEHLHRYTCILQDGLYMIHFCVKCWQDYYKIASPCNALIWNIISVKKVLVFQQK